MFNIEPDEVEPRLRCAVLMLVIAPEAVRVCFDKQNPNLISDFTLKRNLPKLLNLREKKIISKDTWNTLFPSDGRSVSSQDLDIPTMICLLKSIANMKISDKELGSGNPNDDKTHLSTIKGCFDIVKYSNLMQLSIKECTALYRRAEKAITSLGGKSMVKKIKQLENSKLIFNTSDTYLLGLKMKEFQGTVINTNFLRLMSVYLFSVPIAMEQLYDELFDSNDIQISKLQNYIEVKYTNTDRPLWLRYLSVFSKILASKHMPSSEKASSLLAWTHIITMVKQFANVSEDILKNLQILFDCHSKILRLKNGVCSDTDFDRYWKQVSGVLQDICGMDCSIWKSVTFLDAQELSQYQERIPVKGDEILEHSKEEASTPSTSGLQSSQLISSSTKGKRSSLKYKPKKQRGKKRRPTKKDIKRKTSDIQQIELIKKQKQGHGIKKIEFAKDDMDVPISNTEITTWFYKLDLICDGRLVDCTLASTLEHKYTFFSEIVKRNKTKDSFWRELSTVNVSDEVKSNITEFENLLMNARQKDATTSQKVEERLRTVVTCNWSLLFRFLLSHPSNYNMSLLKELLLLSTKRKHSLISKAIAGKIVREYYLRNKQILQTAREIWLGTKCTCSKDNDYSDTCLTSEPVIVIEMIEHIGSTHLEMTFVGLEVQIVILNSEHTSEAQTVGAEYLKNFEIHSISTVMSSKDAERLFIKHSNLTVVCSSAVKSVGFNSCHEMEKKDCVSLYCRVKGIIPVGEEHFSRSLNGNITDVLQAAPVLSAAIKIGDKIGPTTDPNGKYGTICGFVQIYGLTTFLTCAHVVFGEDMLLNETKKNLHGKEHAVYHHSCPSETHKYLGSVYQHNFRHGNADETSVDAALVLFHPQNHPISEQNIAGIDSFYSCSTLGKVSVFLNENHIDGIEYIHKVHTGRWHCTSFGATTGTQKTFIQVAPTGHTEVLMAKPEYDESSQGAYHASMFPVLASFITSDSNLMEVISEQSSDPQDMAPQNQDQSFVIQTIEIPNVHIRVYIDHLQSKGLINRRTVTMYKQCIIYNHNFKPGDSGTGIYVSDPNNHSLKGCIGMAIADFPNGCIATPIGAILRSFKLI